MKILVTGAYGFVGKNVCLSLKTDGHDIVEYDRNHTIDDLKQAVKDVDFVIHLAGINRPQTPEEFYDGNAGFTEVLCRELQLANNKAPLLISSSIQANLDNDYGKSKREGEAIVSTHATDNQSPVYIYRFSNLFGKWCRPNYNSVVATWCYNIANDLDIMVNNRETTLNLMYIDDVVDEIRRALLGQPTVETLGFYTVPVAFNTTLGQLESMIKSFKDSRSTLYVNDMRDGLEKRLYSTYLSYLPEDQFSYPLNMNVDQRGSFTEFIKTSHFGQVSINVSKPGITKGNHWHHTKTEKFLVVSGKGLIQFRLVGQEEIIEYYVSGDSLEVVDIPVGYTHNIINVGDTDLVTVMWANETFDPNRPDTFFEEV